MRVKARNFVWGVRQMNRSEIPDAWKNGCEKVLQSAKHADLPMWTRPSTLDRGSPWIMTCIMNCIQVSRWTTVNAHRDWINCNTSKIFKRFFIQTKTEIQQTIWGKKWSWQLLQQLLLTKRIHIQNLNHVISSIKILKFHHAQLFTELNLL